MKLLGWMHRKFRQNSSEPFKDFSIGNSSACCLTGQPSLDDLQYPPFPNYCPKSLIKGQRDTNYQSGKSLGSPDATRIDEDDLDDETSAETLSELFHGFLAIGTLGTDPGIGGHCTPTFSISMDNIMEKQTEVTEDELKLINDELEKVLNNEESCTISSGRNSHVSTGRNSQVSAGRSSHCSSITLGCKPRESTENNENGTIVCPLQSYLLGSAMGYQETTLTSLSAAKREHRTSLGELFHRTKMAEIEENCALKLDTGGKKMETESEKSAAFLLKKILKKKILHASTRSNADTSGVTIDSVSPETKLHKILQIFHRKVHPESSTTAKKSLKTRLGLKGNIGAGPKHSAQGGDATIPSRASLNENVQRTKSHSNQSHLTLNGNNPFGIGPKEQWIKSDSDYLVLEL